MRVGIRAFWVWAGELALRESGGCVCGFENESSSDLIFFNDVFFIEK